MTFLGIIVLIGLIPAAIARSNGRNFILWWLNGSALFLVALPHALIMKPQRATRSKVTVQALAG